MRELLFTAVWFIVAAGLCDTCFGQKGKLAEPATVSVQTDVLI